MKLWVCEGEDGCRRWKMTEKGEVVAVLVEGDEGNWRWEREKSCVVLEGSWSVGGNGGGQIGGNEKNTYRFVRFF